MPLRKPNLKALAAAAALAFAAGSLPATPAAAAKPEIYTPPFSRLAMDGYDPVSYFDGAPRRGMSGLKVLHQGVEYWFATPQTMARFKANPTAFLPQYGGYCAWAVAHGYTAKGDPTAWKIVGGKLYLNYDARIQKRWEADIPGYIAKADGNWPQVLR